jgi:hypothetical protein
LITSNDLATRLGVSRAIVLRAMAIVAWLFAFWAFAHRWILGAAPSNEDMVVA